jgi:hypothetical protein
MTFSRVLAAPILAAAILAGCIPAQHRVGAQENLLIAAGFKVVPADRPAQVAALRKLPPDRFVARSKGGTTYYLYADPKVCKCLYRGDADAYRQYRKRMLEQNLASEQELASESNEDQAFDWQVWGADYW